YAVPGNSAGGDGDAAAQGAVADRARRAVQARDPVVREEGRPVPQRDQGTGEFPEPAVLAASVYRPDDGQGRVAAGPRRSERDSDGLAGEQAEGAGRWERRWERRFGAERVCRRAGGDGRDAESEPGRGF